jgi:anti-anti-sigma factor
MRPVLRYLDLERRGDVCCVRFRRGRLDEREIHDLTEELLAAGLADACSRLVLSFGGPQPPQLMYSIFLARLITLQRLLGEQGRELVLCDVGPAVQAIFEACRLHDYFHFAADLAAAALPSDG